MTFLEGIPATDIGASGLLVVVIVLILLGKLVPDRIVKRQDIEIERWRSAYENEREARNLTDEQTRELLEFARTTHALIMILFKGENSEAGKRGEVDGEEE